MEVLRLEPLLLRHPPLPPKYQNLSQQHLLGQFFFQTSPMLLSIIDHLLVFMHYLSYHGRLIKGKILPDDDFL